MPKFRVLIADDHTLFRQGIRNLLATEPDISVIGEAPNATKATDIVAELRPDLVLLDISMPGPSSFEAARHILRSYPTTKILFLSMYGDEDYLVQSMDLGASGYLLKDAPAEELLTAIRSVCGGGRYLSPRMTNLLVDDFRHRVKTGQQSRSATLTSREREVLKMLAEGQSVKEIATDLNLSVKTIEAHKFNLMRKLDIHNKAQLVHYAIQKKIIKLNSEAAGIRVRNAITPVA
jgi:two-component system, NarL family, response regulator NreC